MSEKEYYYHHDMSSLKGLEHINGKLDHSIDLPLLGLDGVDLTGKKVLDIATNDGFFAFWAEQQGSNHVDAIDVDHYENYEWGFDGPPADFIKDLKQLDKGEVFRLHKETLKSQVNKYEKSIYDIGQKNFDVNSENNKFFNYDLIINYGLLYHLRNPRQALDACRSACNGVMVLETQIMPGNNLPFALECGSDVGLLTDTDNNWPTESCVVHWLKEACFKKIYIQKESTKRSPTRQRFIAVVEDHFNFDMNDNFTLVDDNYWREVRSQVQMALGGVVG